MKITGIEIRDMGGHEHLVINMDTPVFGFIGKNGTGKSTVLACIKFAWTGILGKKDEAAETFVRNFGQPGGASNGSIKMTFVKDGAQGTIFRQVGKTPKRFLTWDGQTITKAAEVDKTLADIIGGDKQAIAEATFIQQGDLDKMLFGAASDREQLFMRIMMLNYLEKIAQIVDAKIGMISDGLQDLSGPLDEVRLQRDQASAELQGLLGRRDDYPDYTEALAVIDKHLETNRLFEARRAEANNFNQEVREKSARLASLIDAAKIPKVISFDTLAKETKRRTELTIELGRQHEQAAAALQNCQQIAESRQIIQTQSAVAKGLQEELAAIGELANPADLRQRIADQDERARLLREMQKEQGLLNESSRALAAFRQKPEPITDTELDQLEADLAAQQEELTELNLKLQVRELTAGAQGSCCPICDSGLDTAKLAHDLPGLRARKAALEISLSGLRKKHRDGKQARQAHINELTRLSGEVSSHTNLMTSNAQAAARIKTENRADLETLLEETNEKLGRRRALPALIAAAENSVKAAKASLAHYGPEILEAPGDEAILARQLAEITARLTNAEQEAQVTDALYTNACNLDTEIKDARRHEDRIKTQLFEMETVLKEQRDAVDQIWQDAEDRYRKPGEPSPIPQDGGYPGLREFLRGEHEQRQLHLGHIEAQQKTLASIEKRVAELEQRVAADLGKRALITDLKRLRDTFVRSGLPMTYVNHRFARLVQLTQASLSKLEADFAVEVDPSAPISFQFVRTDEAIPYVMPMSKLSGGQKVRLTVAFLMAVQKLILPNVSLLVLDEPTTHLDDEGVISLREMLQNLSSQAQGNESQVIVVDHRIELLSAFGRYLQLQRVLRQHDHRGEK